MIKGEKWVMAGKELRRQFFVLEKKTWSEITLIHPLACIVVQIT
jgi:hypothetical protein